jgi:hypothetical protein
MHKKPSSTDQSTDESSPPRGRKVPGSPRSAKKLRETKQKSASKGSKGSKESKGSSKKEKAAKVKEKKTPGKATPGRQSNAAAGGALAHLQPRWVLVPEDDGGVEIDVSAGRCRVVKGRALRNCTVSTA